MLTVGSLFAGIGGFDLGLERAGMQVVWQCEQDPFCRRVLARHWPGVPCHPDVRALVADAALTGWQALRGDGIRDAAGPRQGSAARSGNEGASGAGVPVPVPYVDVLCGGFPCQDLSYAGRGAGLAGERSGLWREFARVIGELRPRYVIVENVPALTSRGLDVVLGDLAACGFDAEWDHLPASAFGAAHRRDRIWLVAYPGGEQHEGAGDAHEWPRAARLPEADMADPARHGAEEQASAGTVGERARASGERSGTAVAHADGAARNGSRPTGEALPRPSEIERPRRRGSSIGNPWLAEPDVGRVAHGIPQRVDRLRALGNALVPQIAEWIGRQIIEWEAINNERNAA